MKFANLLPLGKPSSLLVCETDGFSLRGTVVARHGTRLNVLHQARAEQVDMADALVDVVGALQADGWAGGGAAILLSPAVLSTLVELPVNPKKPRPVQQMMELVRWEVEPLLAQHMTRWSVGHLLVGRGYMTEEQAQAVMDLQQGKPNKAGGLALSDKYSLRRFGDLAEELGYIKRSQLNACLTGQEWLKADDEGIECGWAAQGPVTDVPGTFNWLVSCVNQSLLQRWIGVFSRQGIKLQRLYPLTGCAAALLPKNHDSDLVLEAHQGLAFAARVRDGTLAKQYHYLNLGKSALDVCLEAYHALDPLPHEPLHLACWHGEGAALAENLRGLLSIEVQLLPNEPLAPGLTPGMAGAARHFSGIGGDGHCIGVREGGPLPPWPRRLEFRAAALVAILLLGMLLAEAILGWRQQAVMQEKAVIDQRWQVVDEATRRIEAQRKQIEARKKALAEQQAKQARMVALLDFYQRAIPERESLVQAVLGVLQDKVPAEVVILSLDESAPNAGLTAPSPNENKSHQDNRVTMENFNLQAWALTETAAQSFIQTMQTALRPWHLEVVDAQVASRPGPLHLQGFAINMRWLKRVERAALSGHS